MSWLFSRALVEASLAEGFLDGEPFVPSKPMPMPQAYLWHGKTTGLWSLFPSGMTCELLTEPHGYRLWTWSVAASRARTSLEPAEAKESTASKAVSGWKWPASFAKYNPATCTWKTRQCSLLGDSEEFSETWPRWGSMRDGECLAHTTPELPTSEKGSGFWPTIRASDGERGGRGDLLQAVRGNANKHFRMWSTPVASDTGHRKKKYAQGGTALSMQAGGPLNPDWTEWLMGWPIKWTALEPLETAKFHEWLQQHGAS